MFGFGYRRFDVEDACPFFYLVRVVRLRISSLESSSKMPLILSISPPPAVAAWCGPRLPPLIVFATRAVLARARVEPRMVACAVR